MKGKTSRYFHYINRWAIIASLSELDGELDSCASCVNWGRCVIYERTWLCPHLNDEHYKPVKIRKVIMKKLIKRRKRHEK